MAFKLKADTLAIAIILLIFLGLELHVTFNNPIVFGDEGFHAAMSQYIAENQEYPAFIPFEGSSILRNGFTNPPLWNLLVAGFLLLGSGETIIRFLTPLIAFILAITVFVLVRKLYDANVAFIASVITAAIPSFATYTVLAYTDMLFTLYITLFFLTFFLFIKKGSQKLWIISALFASLAFLTKTPGLAIPFFLFLMFLYEIVKERTTKPIIKRYLVFVIIFLVLGAGPLLLRNLYLYHTPLCSPLPFFSTDGCNINQFEEQLQFSGRTEQIGTEASVFGMGITNYLDFTYGNLWFVIFTFIAGLIMFLTRHTKSEIAILLALTSLIPILFFSTGRSEDTARWTLGWVPLIAIVSSTFLGELFRAANKYRKHLGIIIFVIVIALSYQNLTPKLAIMGQVKQFSPLFFEACDWINQNTEEDALLYTVWTHRTVYNCQRSAIGNMADISLNTDPDDILSIARQHNITHLFIQKFSLSEESLAERYPISFVTLLENNPEKFKKIYENGPLLDQCLTLGGCDGNIVYELLYA